MCKSFNEVSKQICVGCYWLVKLLYNNEIICSIAEDINMDFNTVKSSNVKITREEALKI